jgi:hypothetical protein
MAKAVTPSGHRTGRHILSDGFWFSPALFRQMIKRRTQMNSHRKATARRVLILTGIGSLMAAVDTLVVSTALSRIRLDLGGRSTSSSGGATPTT